MHTHPEPSNTLLLARDQEYEPYGTRYNGSPRNPGRSVRRLCWPTERPFSTSIAVAMSTTMLLIQDLDNAPDTDLLLSTSQDPQGCPGSPDRHATQFSSSHVCLKAVTHVPQGTLHRRRSIRRCTVGPKQETYFSTDSFRSGSHVRCPRS